MSVKFRTWKYHSGFWRVLKLWLWKNCSLRELRCVWVVQGESFWNHESPDKTGRVKHVKNSVSVNLHCINVDKAHKKEIDMNHLQSNSGRKMLEKFRNDIAIYITMYFKVKQNILITFILQISSLTKCRVLMFQCTTSPQNWKSCQPINFNDFIAYCKSLLFCKIFVWIPRCIYSWYITFTNHHWVRDYLFELIFSWIARLVKLYVNNVYTDKKSLFYTLFKMRLLRFIFNDLHPFFRVMY